MAISYELDDQILVIKTEGDFQPKDLQDIFEKIFSDLAFQPGLNILVHDLDSVFIPTSKQIEVGAKNIENLLKKFSTKMAIVVSSDVNYGMGRMMEIFSAQRGTDVKVFKEIDSAKAWLKTG
jgi:hypothetical protein